MRSHHMEVQRRLRVGVQLGARPRLHRTTIRAGAMEDMHRPMQQQQQQQQQQHHQQRQRQRRRLTAHRTLAGRSPPPGSKVPGDSGWDIFRLRSKDVRTFNQFREVEVIHARWAMLGVVSLLVADLAGSPVPWDPGHDAEGVAAAAPWLALAGALLGLLESYRAAAAAREPDPDKRLYPGRQFDPLGLARRREEGGAVEQPPGLGVLAPWVGGLAGWLAGGWWWQKPELTEQELLHLKSSELRNGRLAMVSFLGVCCAALATGKGPITLLMQNLNDLTTMVEQLQQ